MDLQLSLWSLAVRVGIHQGLLVPDSPKILLLAQPQELDVVLGSWRRVVQRQRLFPVGSQTCSAY